MRRRQRRPSLAERVACACALQGRWWATCVLLVTTGMLTGGIVARGDGAPAVRLSGSGAAEA